MTAALLGATLACAPVDEVPSPDREKQARVSELAGMLVARGAGGEPQIARFAERLDDLTQFAPAEQATRTLTLAVNDAVSGTRISRGASERVAVQLYALMNGGYLTRTGVDRVTQALEQELASAGASPRATAAVGEAGVKVAREPKNPRTDWW